MNAKDRKIVVEIDDEVFGQQITAISEKEFDLILQVMGVPYSKHDDVISVLGTTYQFDIKVSILQ